MAEDREEASAPAQETPAAVSAETAAPSQSQPSEAADQKPAEQLDTPVTMDQQEKAYQEAFEKWSSRNKPAKEEKVEQPLQQTPQQTPQVQLSRKDQELLSRFHIKPSVVAAMSEEERIEFLSHLREQRKVQDQLYQELQQLKSSLAPAAPAPATPAQQERDYRKIIEEYSSPEFASALEAAINARLQGVTGNLQQYNAAVRMLEKLHYEQGLDDARKLLGDTVNLDEEANQKKLLEEARRLFKANHDPAEPWEYTIRDAISQAARTAFVAELKLAEQRKLAASQQRAIRGGPDTAGRPAATAPDEDLETIYRKIEEAQRKGATLEELTALAQQARRQ